MPELEKQALKLAEGPVLDIGCGAGSHCLWMQEQGVECTGIDRSEGAVNAALARGVSRAFSTVIESFKVGKYQTLLLLMNGIGLAGTLENLAPLLTHLSGLLDVEGEILLDSSDIRYLFEEDTDGGIWVPGDRPYYGEITYQWEYEGIKDHVFPWLFVDFNTLEVAAFQAGFTAERLVDGPHFDYLARLRPMEYQNP
jgi:SAM-dependent methyltransferase